MFYSDLTDGYDQASYLHSLSLSILICKMGTVAAHACNGDQMTC